MPVQELLGVTTFGFFLASIFERRRRGRWWPLLLAGTLFFAAALIAVSVARIAGRR